MMYAEFLPPLHLSPGQMQQNFVISSFNTNQKAPRFPKSLENQTVFGLFLAKGFKCVLNTCIHGDVMQEPCNAQHIINLRRSIA